MHKLIASLLALLAGLAGTNHAMSRGFTPETIGLRVKLLQENVDLGEKNHAAKEGDYFEFDASGVRFEYRLARLTEHAATIEGILSTEGRVLSEPTIQLGLEETGTVSVEGPDPNRRGERISYTVELRLDDRNPSAPRPLLPSGGEPGPTPMR